MQKEVSKALTLEGFEDVVVSEATRVSGTERDGFLGENPRGNEA